MKYLGTDRCSSELHFIVSSQHTHHGQAEIFSHVLRHVHQPPAGGGDQDEAVQGLEKGLVGQRAVRPVPSWESLEKGKASSASVTLSASLQVVNL